jgi:hypothetical protein
VTKNISESKPLGKKCWKDQIEMAVRCRERFTGGESEETEAKVNGRK